MFFDWVLGVAFRPSATFDRSREHLRFGYWWIVLSVMTLDTVLNIFHPRIGTGIEYWSATTFTMILQDLVLFDIQALLLLGAGRLLGWKLIWPEATKIAGLLWSILLLEDLVTFYPSLRGMTTIEIWIMGAFGLWYVVAGIAGIYRLAKLPLWRAVLGGLAAFGLWQGAIVALSWYSLTHPPLP